MSGTGWICVKPPCKGKNIRNTGMACSNCGLRDSAPYVYIEAPEPSDPPKKDDDKGKGKAA
ncbi:hypothetical protein ACHAP5_007316 [Fusarium lateritium]